MKKFELPEMDISWFTDNVLTNASYTILEHEANDAAGSTIISKELVDLYSISYADMGK